MKCPNCKSPDSKVLETRTLFGTTIKRRRECESCGHRWSTAELAVKHVTKTSEWWFYPPGHVAGEPVWRYRRGKVGA